jgi:plasmid stabilization system protein ParE
MDFRVELSEQAQRDIAAIYDWLHSQQAGEALKSIAAYASRRQTR